MNETRSDVERILTMFDGLGLNESADSIKMITIPGAPWSKSRPRFSKGRAYRDQDDVDAEVRTSGHMKAVVKEPLKGNAGLVCLFFRPNRQRIDTDNLIKHVCDSANGVLWIDDSQCTAVMGVIELDADNPRTVIAVGEHVSTLKRGSDATAPCAVCGQPIPLDGHRGKPPKTCSLECRQSDKGYPDLSKLFPCAQCGKLFRRRNRTIICCSKECGRARQIGTRKAKSRGVSNCQDCGKQLAHNRGGRCRDCWKVNLATERRTSRVSTIKERTND